MVNDEQFACTSTTSRSLLLVFETTALERREDKIDPVMESEWIRVVLLVGMQRGGVDDHFYVVLSIHSHFYRI